MPIIIKYTYIAGASSIHFVFSSGSIFLSISQQNFDHILVVTCFTRSRSPMRRNVDWTHVEKEHNRQVEERRVIYVGRIPEDTTKAELRRRFEVFGPIVDINLHFREHA